jgi:hypothetical protein
MALKKKEIDDLLRRASKKQLAELRARLDEIDEAEPDDDEADDAPSPHPYAEAYSQLRYGSPLDELRRLDRQRRREQGLDDVGGGADAQPPDNVFTIAHLRGGR